MCTGEPLRVHGLARFQQIVSAFGVAVYPNPPPKAPARPHSLYHRVCQSSGLHEGICSERTCHQPRTRLQRLSPLRLFWGPGLEHYVPSKIRRIAHAHAHAHAHTHTHTHTHTCTSFRPASNSTDNWCSSALRIRYVSGYQGLPGYRVRGYRVTGLPGVTG
jgi:hypothetical protein